MSGTTYHSIGFRWSHPHMSGLYDTVLELTIDDQNDPRMLHVYALVGWWREKAQAKAEAEALAGRADLPFYG